MFNEITSLADDEKPNYRRRYKQQFAKQTSEFSYEHAVNCEDINGFKITRVNRHVAP